VGGCNDIGSEQGKKGGADGNVGMQRRSERVLQWSRRVGLCEETRSGAPTRFGLRR
jgi:hypothetical protein